MATQKFVNGSMMLGLTITIFSLGFTFSLRSLLSSFLLLCSLIFAFLTYKVFMEP
ncbi:MAG: hypothetical protein AABW73_02715 [Nanoarchaeota archaeon]